jgi:hypothetical protein
MILPELIEWIFNSLVGMAMNVLDVPMAQIHWVRFGEYRWQETLPLSPVEGSSSVFQVICSLSPGYHQVWPSCFGLCLQ